MSIALTREHLMRMPGVSNFRTRSTTTLTGTVKRYYDSTTFEYEYRPVIGITMEYEYSTSECRSVRMLHMSECTNGTFYI